MPGKTPHRCGLEQCGRIGEGRKYLARRVLLAVEREIEFGGREIGGELFELSLLAFALLGRSLSL